MRAVDAHREKNYSIAIKYINNAIQENSDHHHLYNVRANIQEDAGNALAAINDYKKALYVSGSDWYASYNQIAINYLNRKEFNRALIAFDIAIELKTKLENDGINENVMPYIVDGVVSRVDSEKMFTNRANVKLSLQDFQGCVDDCQKAVFANPEYSNSYFILGLLFMTVGQQDDALKAFKVADSKGHPQAKNIINQYF
jgi:tetratricopeptide (TPR) repeat protein